MNICVTQPQRVDYINLIQNILNKAGKRTVDLHNIWWPVPFTIYTNKNHQSILARLPLVPHIHTGKPNSPFSAKHHPFQAQTTRSPHTIPVLGLILPFTAQSHPPFSVFLTPPPPPCAACYKIQLHMCCLLQDTIAVVGSSQGMARSTKSNHEASPEMTMVYHKN